MTFGAGISKTFLPKGFFASAFNCGVRRYRPDVGLLFSEVPCAAAGVFTQSTCVGEHVKYCKELLPSENIQALITNSGQANTAVGPLGAKDNLLMAEAVAEALGLDSIQVLTASTGVIGQRMEIEKITSVIPNLVAGQSDTAESFATAIMTTDLVPKTVTTTLKLKQGEVRLTGIAKGSGMIHPNMATMLGYVLTDVKMNSKLAQDLLVKAVNPTFNMISVDGEPSTNDSVYLLANGQSGVSILDQEDEALFFETLRNVCEVLAKSIARDGEGATKLVEVRLKGAPSQELAVKWARSITVSPLIKTAIHGRDPNWGRIVGRLGSEGVPAEAFSKMSLSLQSQDLIKKGDVLTIDLNELSQKLKTDEILIELDLGLGAFEAVAWGCDLSAKYVQINAEYTS